MVKLRSYRVRTTYVLTVLYVMYLIGGTLPQLLSSARMNDVLFMVFPQSRLRTLCLYFFFPDSFFTTKAIINT